jgi:hypothetical protein
MAQMDNVSFICDGKKDSNQMVSIEKAVFLNKKLPNTKTVSDKAQTCECLLTQ